MSYWITTHWPVPDQNWPRNVFVREEHKTVPQIGDIVHVYESKYATVNNKRVKSVYRVQGVRRGPKQELPVGYGGIIGTMAVVEERRKLRESDVVYEYAPGNLSRWEIIPCVGFQEARLLHDELLAILALPQSTPATIFDLYRVRPEHVSRLMAKLT